MTQQPLSLTEPKGFYQMAYRIRDQRIDKDPPRVVEVQATPDQVNQLLNQGYLVRERLIQGDLLALLRAALDEVAEAAGGQEAASANSSFSGLFVRGLLDKHPSFLEMLHFAPLLSVARAMLGPKVQVHEFAMRVSYPGASSTGVEWHIHQRVMPDPLPPLFARPIVVDNLIYLDDITEASGPLVVMPGSHLRDEDLAEKDFSDKPGQVTVTLPAGSCVTSHSSLWHKAQPTQAGGGVRRLLVLSYSPVWLKPTTLTAAATGGSGLTTALKDADEETRELIGIAGSY